MKNYQDKNDKQKFPMANKPTKGLGTKRNKEKKQERFEEIIG